MNWMGGNLVKYQRKMNSRNAKIQERIRIEEYILRRQQNQRHQCGPLFGSNIYTSSSSNKKLFFVGNNFNKSKWNMNVSKVIIPNKNPMIQDANSYSLDEDSANIIGENDNDEVVGYDVNEHDENNNKFQNFDEFDLEKKFVPKNFPPFLKLYQELYDSLFNITGVEPKPIGSSPSSSSKRKYIDISSSDQQNDHQYDLNLSGYLRNKYSTTSNGVVGDSNNKDQQQQYRHFQIKRSRGEIFFFPRTPSPSINQEISTIQSFNYNNNDNKINNDYENELL